MEDEKFKIVFEPGCFDAFDGTQEELDELLAEITRLVESGEIFEQAMLATIDDLPDSLLETLLELGDGEEEDVPFVAHPVGRTIH